MACCARYCEAEAHFGPKMAEGDLRLYRRRGVTGITRALLSELRKWPLQGKHLLDIGGGIGILGAELAASGLAGATLVEASPAYLEAARRELEPRFAGRPTEFVLGDFALLADTLPDRDVVTLDRVVCCYPDFGALLQGAAARTLSLLAFTYPRDRWHTRLTIALENFLRRVKGGGFRVFVHKPDLMRARLEAAGLVPAVRRETFVWALELYRRS